MFGRLNNTNFSIFRLFGAISAQLRGVLAERLDKSRIDNLPALVRFIHTRSAYVGQTSLYGYLKTRMGTQYRVIFEDDAFAGPLNAAKWKVYAACLSDLSIFAVATLVEREKLGVVSAEQLAIHSFASAVQDTFDDCSIASLADESLLTFAARVHMVDWVNATELANAFVVSPEVLATSAPVSEEFKALDREIVINSIRFRWQDIRGQFRKRVDARALVAAWGNSDQNKSKEVIAD
jgi:hypothetical protein